MEGMESPLLDLNNPVTGVDKGQHCKENKRKRVLKQIVKASKDYWFNHTGDFIIPSPKYIPTTYKDSMFPSGLALHHPASGKLL